MLLRLYIGMGSFLLWGADCGFWVLWVCAVVLNVFADCGFLLIMIGLYIIRFKGVSSDLKWKKKYMFLLRIVVSV